MLESEALLSVALHGGRRCQPLTRGRGCGRGCGRISATTRRPRAGPATDSSRVDGLICRGGVDVPFRDSAVPGNIFPGN